MRYSLLLISLTLGGVAAVPVAALGKGDTIRAPVLTPGDTWTYANSHDIRGVIRSSHDTMTLTRADSRFIAVEVRPAGTATPGSERLLGPNWSVMRSVNGRQTVVNQPLAFPLTLNKSWALSYAEFNPADRTHSREEISFTYKVTGWEDVTVAAGTFHAMKIEADGTWTANLPPNVVTARGRAPNGANVAVLSQQGARVASGRMLDTFWYVPEVHRWVKSEEDIYNTAGVRTKHETTELESFTLADPHAATAETSPNADAAEPLRPKRAKVRRPPSAAQPAPPPVSPAPVAPRRTTPESPTLLQELRAVVPSALKGEALVL